jgi:PAS domain S-box-containing protein
MRAEDKVNILMVDDQPGKLLSYEVILSQLGENLIKAGSASQALEYLLKTDIAVILVDVCMPETDGFQLVSMIREHPRFKETAIIFISAVQLADVDHLRAYAMGAVDYVPVPVVAEVLRAKVKVFVELYRKTKQLESFNRELERRVAERTADLEASNAQLMASERRRSLALTAGNMGSWDLDVATGECTWDEGQYRLYGVDRSFVTTINAVASFIHESDRELVEETFRRVGTTGERGQIEFRINRPSGEQRWCLGTVTLTGGSVNHPTRLSGCTVDITDRKLAEERQVLLAREVDHRAKNALAVVQSLVRLTRAESITDFVQAVDGRVRALASVHTLLSESRWEGASLRQLVEDEMEPYQSRQGGQIKIEGPPVLLLPAAAQTFALAIHELATNAAKYGAISRTPGRVQITWKLKGENLVMMWEEVGGTTTREPTSKGFGLTVIQASIEGQLGGDVKMNWRPQGLRCVFAIPRPKIMRTPDPSLLVEKDEEPEVPTKPLQGRRILLVEDEILVGMMVRDMLEDFGFDVSGPVTDLAGATKAAETDGLDAAVLDVNLGGELVYPVAVALTQRGVPFIFVTGYDCDSIDKRFAHIPTLRKPIEAHLLHRLLVANPTAAVA